MSKLIVMVGFALAIFFNPVYAQEPQQIKSLDDCVSSIIDFMYMLSLSDNTRFDPLAPETRILFTDMCNFFHEKLGYWIGSKEIMMAPNSPTMLELQSEFNSKHQDQMCQVLQLSKLSGC